MPSSFCYGQHELLDCGSDSASSRGAIDFIPHGASSEIEVNCMNMDDDVSVGSFCSSSASTASSCGSPCGSKISNHVGRGQITQSSNADAHCPILWGGQLGESHGGSSRKAQLPGWHQRISGPPSHGKKEKKKRASYEREARSIMSKLESALLTTG